MTAATPSRASRWRAVLTRSIAQPRTWETFRRGAPKACMAHLGYRFDV
jgi:hypothetical protein